MPKNSPRIDLTGQVFGRLTVISYRPGTAKNPGRWKCLCSCGTIKHILAGQLTHNKTRSCGCLLKDYQNSYRDISDQKYGRWTPKKYLGEGMWWCICDCGTEKSVAASSLWSGDSKSCGCLKKELHRERRLKDLAGQKFNMLTALYYMADSLWWCRCDCGNELPVDRHNLGRNISCGCLNISKGEHKIRKVLESFNLVLDEDYFPEHRFESCRDNKPLPFDFYLPEFNILIEFQGEQHFEPLEYFTQGNIEVFHTIQRHDAIKEKWATENDFYFISIRYDEYDQIEDILYKALFS